MCIYFIIFYAHISLEITIIYTAHTPRYIAKNLKKTQYIITIISWWTYYYNDIVTINYELFTLKKKKKCTYNNNNNNNADPVIIFIFSTRKTEVYNIIKAARCTNRILYEDGFYNKKIINILAWIIFYYYYYTRT